MYASLVPRYGLRNIVRKVNRYPLCESRGRWKREIEGRRERCIIFREFSLKKKKKKRRKKYFKAAHDVMNECNIIMR